MRPPNWGTAACNVRVVSRFVLKVRAFLLRPLPLFLASAFPLLPFHVPPHYVRLVSQPLPSNHFHSWAEQSVGRVQ